MAFKMKVSNADVLKKLQATLEDPKKILSKAAEIGAETTLNLISRGFKRGEDPYGRPWDAPNNLQITGGIRSYAKKKVDASGWSIHSTDEKAIWHHDPQPRDSWKGKSLPQRLQVPTDAAGGLPERWEKRIKNAIEKAFAHILK